MTRSFFRRHVPFEQGVFLLFYSVGQRMTRRAIGMQKIGMRKFLLHTMEWRVDGPDFSVKFPNFSKCLQKTVTLRQYTKGKSKKGDERQE